MKTWFKMLLIALAATLFLTGCNNDNDSSDNGTELVSVEEIDSFVDFDEFEARMLAERAVDLNTMSGTLGGYDTMLNAAQDGQEAVISLRKVWELIEPVFKDFIQTKPFWSYKVTWRSSPDAPIQSGLFIKRFSWHSAPVLVLTHPTETERKYSPSRVSPWTPWIDGAFNRVFGIIFACAGFNVVIPDYPGMGDNYQVHPYCLKSLGKSAATMVDAVRKEFTTDTSQTYIMGFSEGGYAALATAQYMMAHPKNKYNLKAVAALSGPYDLNGTMKNLMLSAGADFLCPYFLPYTIDGYFAAYPEVRYLNFDQAIVKNPVTDGSTYYDTLHDMLNGEYSGSQITEFMEFATPDNSTDKKYYGPISVTTTKFQNELKNATSELNAKLTENTLVDSNWYPGSSIKFYFSHFINDDCVPVGNTEAMKKVWGTYNNVKFSIYDTTSPLSKADVGSWHAASIAQAYVGGLRFLLDQPGMEEILSNEQN